MLEAAAAQPLPQGKPTAPDCLQVCPLNVRTALFSASTGLPPPALSTASNKQLADDKARPKFSYQGSLATMLTAAYSWLRT